MAIVMSMRWAEVTPPLYDQVRTAVGWLDTAPEGAHVHVVAFADDGLHVTDVWDSAEAFQAFVDTRLMPEVQRLGVPGQPQIEFHPLHELFAPDPATILTT